jgi:hypothetical protein
MSCGFSALWGQPEARRDHSREEPTHGNSACDRHAQSLAMNHLVIAASWCLVHFCFFLLQRGTGLLRGEKRIFAFHIASFGGLVATIVVLTSADPWIAVMSSAALHGIYSLTFLEMWSLAEGGYTIALLRASSTQPMDHDSLLQTLARLGDGKREARIDGLTTLQLVSVGEDHIVRLTPFGQVASSLLVAVRWLCIRGATG